jgi:hypothetical protein
LQICGKYYALAVETAVLLQARHLDWCHLQGKRVVAVNICLPMVWKHYNGIHHVFSLFSHDKKRLAVLGRNGGEGIQ